MIHFTELVYLAAPFDTPEQRAFNDRIAKLIRAYNFPLFMPQHLPPQLLENGCLDDWQPDAELAELPCNAVTLPRFMSAACRDALNWANLVLAVYYGDEFDALTAFDVGYALGRRVNIVGIQNTLTPHVQQAARPIRLPAPSDCNRVILTPEDDELFTDRLIPILNRYFTPHKLV